MTSPSPVARRIAFAILLALAVAIAWRVASVSRTGAPAAEPGGRSGAISPSVEDGPTPKIETPRAEAPAPGPVPAEARAARAEVASAADETLFEIRVSCGDDGSPVNGAWIDVGWLAATTAADGVARVLRGDDEDFLAQWKIGDLKLDVAAKGYVRDQFAVPPGARVVEVELWRAVVLSGVVVDAATGRPLPHASVFVSDKIDSIGRGWSYAHGVDADGRMEPVRVPMHVPVHVEVENQGYAVTRFEHVLAGDFDAVWALGEGGTVRGVVRDPNGAPVEGARIELASELGCASPGAESFTDSCGRFELRGLQVPCAYYVEARRVDRARDGFGYAGTGRSDPFELTTEVPERDVELTVAILIDRIDVEVVNEQGVPVGFASVHGEHVNAGKARLRVPDPSRRYMSARTDGTGRCSLYTGERGVFEIRASKELHAPSSAQVEVTANETAHVRLVLPRGQKLGGQVVTADGRPAGAVELRATSGGAAETTDSASTDVNGRFLFASLPSGPATIEVLVWDRGPSEPCFVHQVFGAFEAGSTDLRLQLAEPALVTGRIVPPTADRKFACAVSAAGESRELEMDPDGRFAVRLVGLGTPVALRVDFDDRPPAALGPFAAAPGERIDVGDIVKPAGVITGVVIGPDDAPPKDTWITFRVGDWFSSGGAEVDERGAFRVDGVPSGPGTIEAYAEGCAETLIEVADLAHCSPIAIRLGRALRVIGKLHATSRPIVGRVLVSVATRESEHSWMPQGLDYAENGRFEFELRRGRYKLFAKLFGVDEPIQGPEFEIAGEDVTIDWDL